MQQLTTRGQQQIQQQ